MVVCYCLSKISSKLNKKVTYCNTLIELASHIDLETLQVPEMVKQ